MLTTTCYRHCFYTNIQSHRQTTSSGFNTRADHTEIIFSISFIYLSLRNHRRTPVSCSGSIRIKTVFGLAYKGKYILIERKKILKLQMNCAFRIMRKYFCFKYFALSICFQFLSIGLFLPLLIELAHLKFDIKNQSTNCRSRSKAAFVLKLMRQSTPGQVNSYWIILNNFPFFSF